MRSTGRIDFVPRASAAIACAPPTLITSVTPAASSAYNNAGFTEPSGPQGVAAMISGTPAAWAKPAVISAVETKGALPPGT